MSAVNNNLGFGRILQRSICAGVAIAITGLALQGVVGFAASSYQAAAGDVSTVVAHAVVAHAGVGSAARDFVSRAGQRAASSMRVVLSR